MVGQSAEIIGVSAVDRAIGLCSGDNDCVDSGTATCDSSQASSTPRALCESTTSTSHFLRNWCVHDVYRSLGVTLVYRREDGAGYVKV
jgi:hypothetical protein